MNPRNLIVGIIIVVVLLMAFVPVRKKDLTLTGLVDLKALSPDQNTKLADDPMAAVVAAENDEGVVDTLFLAQAEIQGKKFPIKAERVESYFALVSIVRVP